jgi:malate dehydrogenase (oxaloacetate-decarboxylating)(NADP+)
VALAYGLEGDLTFGPDYLIPKPFDPRLIVELPAAVAKAATDTGVATRPLADPRPTAGACSSASSAPAS